MTPYEAWHGEKPKVDHLRVFGCDAYAHIPKNERSKFDLKARTCILVGYGQERKGYRLYDPTRQKIMHSRDVRLNENERDEGIVTSDGVDRQVVLDFSSDPESCAAPTESDIHNGDVAPTESDTHNGDVAEPPLRRSTRERHEPNYYGREWSHLSEIRTEPMTIEEASTCPDSSKWIQAMETEMRSLKDNNVWELVDYT